MMDQVPEESHSGSSLVNGIPATADAVSWQGAATRGRSAGCFGMRDGIIFPMVVPGSMGFEKRWGGISSLVITSFAHCPVLQSSSWVVEALVFSMHFLPVSQ